jgi:uncharacterized protein (TIGR04255 family)
MPYPYLNHAPIVEALIDIQCTWGTEIPHDLAIQKLEKAANSISLEFPKKETQMVQQIAINANPLQSAITVIPNGFILRRIDTVPYAVQFRKNGFTFSRLFPYESWLDLSENAHRLWKKYIAQLGPISVNRIAVRSINRIKVPFPLTGSDDLIKNLRKPPTLPGDFSQIVSFVDQTVSLDSASGANVGFVRALQQAPAGAVEADVVLDIDVYRIITNLDAESPEVWRIIESFHDVKNRVFFNTIGPDIIERYK